jgi:hypothetical protein
LWASKRKPDKLLEVFLKNACLVLALLMLFSAFPLSAEEGENLTIKISLIGPGDELYLWWGHIGLIIEDSETGRSDFYNYGLFSFQTEDFFLNFALGRMLYRCGVSDTAWDMAYYTKTGRDIWNYTLNLEPSARVKIRDFAERNVLPENRNYYYHQFRDNCATRIRDLIDIGLDGQFKAKYGEAPGRFSLRGHVRRHTWFSPFFDWFLNFLMGQNIDGPTTVWEEMFLPAEICRNIEEFSYTDSRGELRPLFGGRETVNTGKIRPAVLEKPRLQWPRELALGIPVALLLLFFTLLQGRRFSQRTNTLGRVFWGTGQSLLGLFFGICGCLLFFLSFFTNHDYTYRNANILFVNPLLLAAPALGVLYLRSKTQAQRFFREQLIRGLWSFVLLGGILSILIKISPKFYQQNQVTLALLLPQAAALSLLPVLFNRTPQSSTKKRSISPKSPS